MRRRNTDCLVLRLRGMVLVACVAAASGPALGWHDEGHVFIALAGVEALPAEGEDPVPAFFREGAEAVAHGSIDPDVFKHRDAEHLRPAERPEHYLDYEMLRGLELPRDRDAYRALCAEHGLDPNRVGMLPYAIAEWADRLTLAFAEHRKWPDNPHIKAKCLVYAGLLSHYTGDVGMPLHTTVHFDGRVEGIPAEWPKDEPRDQPASPRTGIHERVDALPTHLPYHAIFPKDGEPLKVEAYDDLFAGTLAAILESHAEVDATYALEPRLPARGEPIEHDGVRDFTIDRTRHAASFTAAVFVTCWQRSADIELERWLDRPAFDDDMDRDQHVPQPPLVADE